MGKAEEISDRLNGDIVDSFREVTVGKEAVDVFVRKLLEHLEVGPDMKIAAFLQGELELSIVVQQKNPCRRANCVFDCYDGTWRIGTIDENMDQKYLDSTGLEDEAEQVVSWIKKGRHGQQKKT